MKRDFLILMVLLILTCGTSAWGVCPADTVDTGICDSMYIEPWPAGIMDTVFQHPGPYTIKIPLYVTHDVTEPSLDSIATFVLPFCYTQTNPTKYCSISAYWNKILWTPSFLPRSIFRHLVIGTDTTHNWMMDLFDREEGQEWNFISLETDGVSHFWLAMIPTGTEDMRFGTGEHTLLFTMTFVLQDTMHFCIDTCLWPPSSRLDFERFDAKAYFPRMGTTHDPLSYKVCFPSRDTSDVREIEGDNIKPSDFSLSQNYPNPFNPTTNFQFTIPKSSHVKIEIFNIVGQKVSTLVDGDMKPGIYAADWNGRDVNGKSVSSGIYFYRMQAGDFSDMKKMVLVK